MPTPRLRHTARALLLDAHDRLLLARHDLTRRHLGEVIWAPPGGGLEPGETPVDAVVRELIEEVGYPARAEDVQHVWHQEVISPTYARGWDGAVHDYFLVRCDTFEAAGTQSADLRAAEGITEFRWWRLADMERAADSEAFRPRQLPDLLRDLLSDSPASYPIEICPAAGPSSPQDASRT